MKENVKNSQNLAKKQSDRRRFFIINMFYNDGNVDKKFQPSI